MYDFGGGKKKPYLPFRLVNGISRPWDWRALFPQPRLKGELTLAGRAKLADDDRGDLGTGQTSWKKHPDNLIIHHWHVSGPEGRNSSCRAQSRTS